MSEHSLNGNSEPLHAGQAPGTRDRRIPSLDGLRAISIALVLIAHASGAPGFPWRRAVDAVPISFGNLGVRVFFVISGFLITGLLAREHATTGRIRLGAFYRRRAYRILPAYLVYLAVILALVAAGLVPHTDVSARTVVHALTYTINYDRAPGWLLGHFWSLSVEEQFYLLWPPLLVWLGLRGGARGAAIYVLAAPVLRLAIYTLAPGSIDYLTLAFETVADALAVGCLLALWGPTLARQSWFRRLLDSRVGMMLVLGAVIGAALLDSHPRAAIAVGIPVKNVGIALLIAWAVQARPAIGGAVHRALNARPVAFVGALSYSIYVWQQPFLAAAPMIPGLRFPVNVALALAAAFLSYYLVELPFLRLRVRLQRRTSAQSPRTAPSVDAAA